MSPNGSIRPISGSGVLVDPKGIILTNAHVAQYVLLSESPRVGLNCYIRTGSPAVLRWIPKVMYLPPAWMEAHAVDITSARPVGTGEHDYALLSIVGSADGAPLPTSFPFVAPDTREAIGFLGDQVIAASYPAEFIGSSAGFNIYSASSITSIRQLFTFVDSTVDVISVGGVIEAQSGSSGGAIVNAWNRLIGIITTTSDGATTADRDLRAITLSYINRDIAAQSGSNLSTTLSGNPVAQTEQFSAHTAPRLIKMLLDQILK
ncbi:MAG: serine protease [Candidatus Paceibacterota bacterium]